MREIYRDRQRQTDRKGEIFVYPYKVTSSKYNVLSWQWGIDEEFEFSLRFAVEVCYD